MNNLQGFSAGLEEVYKRKEAERLAWQDEIGEPKVFIPDSDEELKKAGFGIGLWKVDGGVITVRRMANGYHPETLILYTEEVIKTLCTVLDN